MDPVLRRVREDLLPWLGEEDEEPSVLVRVQDRPKAVGLPAARPADDEGLRSWV